MSKWEHCPDCAFTAGHAERCRYYGLTMREARAQNVRDQAEHIALHTPLPATWRAGVEMTDALQQEIVAYGIEVALQALTDNYQNREDYAS